MTQGSKTLDDWHSAIAHDPGDPANYRGRGILYAEMGELGHALADLSIAIRLDPSDADSVYRRAMVCLRIGDREGARSDLAVLLRLDPDRLEVRRHLRSLGEDTEIPDQRPELSLPSFEWPWRSIAVPRLVSYLLVLIVVAGVAAIILAARGREDDVEYPTVSNLSGPSGRRHFEYKRYMEQLINDERRLQGLGPVTLGRNIVAQRHAEASVDGCFLSHWNPDGMKPYMRYSLAGGYQSNRENVSGSNYCPGGTAQNPPEVDVRNEIRKAMESWMNSPGHRDAILDPWARRVNIGLEWNSNNFWAVQHFEGDYVEYSVFPDIVGDILILRGRTRNGITLDLRSHLFVAIQYDPTPHALSRGQLARTYCYDWGVPVAILRLPPSQGNYFDHEDVAESVGFCPDPRDVPPDAPPPGSYREARELWMSARDASDQKTEQEVNVMQVTASVWEVNEDSFSIRANLREVTGRYGPGVYTIVVVAIPKGQEVILTQHSIFHKTRPPR